MHAANNSKRAGDLLNKAHAVVSRLTGENIPSTPGLPEMDTMNKMGALQILNEYTAENMDRLEKLVVWMEGHL